MNNTQGERTGGIKVMMILNTVKNEPEDDKATEIYLKYYSTMLYKAYSILHNKESAKDAVSEAMIKIIKNIDKIGEVSSYKTRGYIVIIVKNTAFDILKKQKAMPEDPVDLVEDMPDSVISLIDNFVSEENYQKIINAIHSLPDSLRDVMYMSAVEEYDNKSISKMLNLSYDVVKMRLSRAKKEVRKILNKMGDL